MEKVKSPSKKERKVLTNLVLSPAFGRDYISPEDVLKDWDLGKEFFVESSGLREKMPFVNKKGFYRNPNGVFSSVIYVHFRYAGLSKRKVIKPL